MFLLTISNLTINFYISNFENNSLSAIIFSKEVEIKLEPNKRSDTLFNLHEGTKVQIIENFDDQWVKIMLSDGQIGWIIKNQIKIL
jgi:SH3-like domain-containing protein